MFSSLDAVMTGPEVNAPVTDAAGEWLAEGDLVWRGRRVVGEASLRIT